MKYYAARHIYGAYYSNDINGAISFDTKAERDTFIEETEDSDKYSPITRADLRLEKVRIYTKAFTEIEIYKYLSGEFCEDDYEDYDAEFSVYGRDLY